MIEISSLDDLIWLSETCEIECKLAAGQDGRGKLPDDFWPTYSAFANTHGGLVVLGVKEKQGKFELRGLPDADRLITDLFNTLNNRNKVSVNLLTDSHVKKMPLPGGDIVLVQIPAASRKQKPVYLNGNPFNGNTYRRLHEGDRHCDDETVKRMLAEQVEDERDQRILPDFGIDDIDAESLRIYRQMLRDRNPAHPFLEYEGVEFLQKIGGWRRDRKNSEAGLTLAGLLMFGQWQAIQEAMPHYFVDFQERPEAKAERRWIDRLVPDGTWSGNIFDFYRKVYRKLIADLKVPFALKNGQRQDDTPVHEALREALVNTLVHADYTGRVSILVVKRPDMFGFRNPGGSRIPLEQVLHGGESDCRNRLMHQMFLMIGLGERAGSGVPKIFSGWASQHWRPPALYVKDEPEQTLLELRMVDLLPDEVLTALREHFGKKLDTLTREERLILATAFIEQVVSHARVAEISGLHPHDLTMTLQRLVRDGLLMSAGRSRGTIYHLPGENLPTPEQVFGSSTQTTIPTETDSGGLLQSSGGLPQSSGGLPQSSGGLERTQGPYGRNVPELDRPLVDTLDGLDAEYGRELMIAALDVAEHGKCSRETLEEAVLDLCATSYMTLSVLARLLNRSEEYLRKEVLNRLVADKRLRRAFPTKPNDPRQAYTSTNETS